MIFCKIKKLKCDPKLHYSLVKYKKKISYDILKDISEHITLVKLMDSLGNLNHDISVVGYCIFDSNYRKALVLNRERGPAGSREQPEPDQESLGGTG